MQEINDAPEDKEETYGWVEQHRAQAYHRDLNRYINLIYDTRSPSQILRDNLLGSSIINNREIMYAQDVNDKCGQDVLESMSKTIDLLLSN